MKKILKRATACLLAVLMLAGEATVQVAAIDSNGNGTTKTVSYVATHNYTVYYLDLKGMCYIMRDKGIDVGVSYVSNASNVTFRWQAYNLDKHKWSLVADWTGSNWVTWKPEKGNFWLYVEAMTPDGATQNTIMCFASQKDYSHHSLNLNGMCYNIYDDRIDVGIAYDSDCLLYTSPSPRDGGTSRMPSSA